MRITVATLLAALLIAAAPAAARAASLQFTDWTAARSTSASGTLLGHPVSLTGNDIHAGSVTNGSFQSFNSPEFTPQLANSDMVEFGSANGNQYRLDFGAPVQDPVFELFSLGSTLTFPAGTQLVKVSGQPGLAVSGNTVSATSVDDVNGTVRVVGVVSVVTWSTTLNHAGPADGVDLQVGGTTPPNTPPAGCPSCDSDHDGVTDALDCDDLNRNIRQGTHDIPGNGIDEDCSGKDAPLPKLRRYVAFSVVPAPPRRRVRLIALEVDNARQGDVIRLACSGRGCPLRHRTLKVKRKTRRFNVLTRRFRRARLHRGAVVTLRIEHAGRRAQIHRIKIRSAARTRKTVSWDP
jgi:hypothetical protein